MVVVATAIPQQLEKIVSGQSSGKRAIPLEAQGDLLFQYKRSSFAPYLDSVFEVSNGAMPVAVTLAEISDTGLAAKPVKSKRAVVTDVVQEDRFTLLFRGPLGENALRQDVYDVDHPALGKFRLLLVPVLTPFKDAHYYEAVINRSLK